MSVTECAFCRDHPYRMTTDDRGRNTYSLKWIITTDSYMSPRAVASEAQQTDQGFTNPLPGFWSTYNFQGQTDPHAYFKGGLQLYLQDARNNKLIWNCEGVYEPLSEGQTSLHSNVSPTLRPAMYRLESEAYNEVVMTDKDGNAIVDSAGVVFDENPEEEYVRDVLVIVKNVADLNTVIAYNNLYRYSVNSDTFYGAAPRHAKIDNVTSSSIITEGNFTYYQAYIRIVFNWRPWDLSILDQGYYHKDPQGGSDLLRAVRFDQDGNEEPTIKPILLDGNGGIGDPNNPVFREFRLRREVPYAALAAL